MALFPVHKNYTLHQEQKGRLHWFSKETKKTVEPIDTRKFFNQDADNLVKKYLVEKKNNQ